jgi:non-specific serine/threonine protein kinase/serine/threonine-protein kinase
MQLMTPEYASPEQVRGDPVTTATDVYALGVILYILLTDRRPYEFSTHSADEMVRVVCHEDPRPPSAMVAASRRQLSGDLDTIVLKALRKEPERRYKSVDDLSEDIRRYLAGMTVGARPDTLRYRTAKFVTRHRGAVAGAAIAALSLVAGLAATTYQARIAESNRQRAERRFQDVRRIANSLVFELHDSIADLPGATAARALVLRRASELFDTLVVDAPGDPVLGEEVAAAYHRLGGVLGSAGESSLGDRHAAERAHRKGLSVRTQLAAAAPTDLDRQDRLASSHIELSYAIEDGKEALAHAREAAGIGERITAARPENAGYKRRLANARFAEGFQLVNAGDLAGATQAFERAASVYEGLLALAPGDPTLRRNATLVHKRLGAILTRQRQFPDALEHYRKAVSADEARVAKDATSVTARYDLSVSLVDLGVTLGQSGDWGGQIEACERALALREELSRADPSNAQARAGMISVLPRLAGALQALGRHERALVYLRRALAIPGPSPADPVSLAGVHFTMASVYLDLKRWDEAARSATMSVESWQALFTLNPANPWYRTGLARARELLGTALAGVASQPGRSADQAAADWRRASASFRTALSLALALESEGQLVGTDATLPIRIRKALAGCERALTAGGAGGQR